MGFQVHDSQSIPVGSDVDPAVASGHSTPATTAIGAEIVTPHSPEEIVSRLTSLAKRGDLPGFAPGRGEVLFSVAAHGSPFDKRVIAVCFRDGGQTRLRFRTRLNRKSPLVMSLVTLITIWPGVWLTDSMLRTYFPGYDYATWMWYLPLSILPLPWAVRSVIRKTNRTTSESATQAIGTLAAAIDARPA